MKHNEHHKKCNMTIPAWLWFKLYRFGGKEEWTDEKQKLGESILEDLKAQMSLYKHPVLEPNNYDNVGWYSKCPCPDCCNVKMMNEN